MAMTPTPQRSCPQHPAKLLRWYDRHRRVLRGGRRPATARRLTRLAVEIMLQQTTVATVRLFSPPL